MYEHEKAYHCQHPEYRVLASWANTVRFGYTEAFEDGSQYHGSSAGSGLFQEETFDPIWSTSRFAFTVHKVRTLQELHVKIRSWTLQSNLTDALDLNPSNLNNDELDLETLLRNYAALKVHLAKMEESAFQSETSIWEFSLFLNHFLLDGDVFKSFGFEALYEAGTLSRSHWQDIQHWSILRDLDELECGVAEVNGGFEEESRRSQPATSEASEEQQSASCDFVNSGYGLRLTEGTQKWQERRQVLTTGWYMDLKSGIVCYDGFTRFSDFPNYDTWKLAVYHNVLAAIDWELLQERASERASGRVSEMPQEKAIAYRHTQALFMSEHAHFYRCSRNSAVRSKFRAIGDSLASPRKMWRTGISTIRRLLNNSLPRSLKKILSLLLVADTMRSYISQRTANETSGGEVLPRPESRAAKEEFLNDLDRWRSILHTDEHSAFDSIVKALWSKEPTLPSERFLDPKYEADTLHFQTLIAALIRETGLLGQGGISENLQRKRLSSIQDDHQTTVTPPSSNASWDETCDRQDASKPPEPEGIHDPGPRPTIPTLVYSCKPVDALVVLMMAGAIFAFVIVFLLCSRDSKRWSVYLDLLKAQSSLDYLQNSYMSVLQHVTCLGDLPGVLDQTVELLANGDLQAGGHLGKTLIDQCQKWGCSNRELAMLHDAIIVQERKFTWWLKSRSLHISCMLLETYLALHESPSLGSFCGGHTPAHETRSTAPTPAALANMEPPTGDLDTVPNYNSYPSEEPQFRAEDEPITDSQSSGNSLSPYSSSAGANDPVSITDLSPAKLQCLQCSKHFTNIGNLNRHVRTKHREQGRYACPNCGKVLKSKWYAEEHGRTRCKMRQIVLHT